MGHENDVSKSDFVTGKKNSFKAVAAPPDQHAHVFAMTRMLVAGKDAEAKDINIVRGQGAKDARYAGFVVNQGFALVEPPAPTQRHGLGLG